MNKKFNKMKYKVKNAVGENSSYLTKKGRKYKNWKKADLKNRDFKAF